MGSGASGIRIKLGRNMWFLLLCAAVAFFAAAFASSRLYNSSGMTARRVGRLTDQRLEILKGYVAEAMAQDPEEWMRLDGMPEDMTIYRYADDTLQSWCNQFSTENDDISRRTLIERFTDTRNSLVSPLLGADTLWRYMNIGPKWYIVRNFPYSENGLIIAGLEVRNPLDDSSVNNVNPRLKLHESFALYPISHSGGTPVYVDGQPMLKIIGEGSPSDALTPSASLWLSVILLLVALLLFLATHRSLLNMGLCLLASFVAVSALYYFGRGLHVSTSIFSPTVYASGPIWYSLGAVLLMNLLIYTLLVSLYICRRPLLRLMWKREWTRVLYTVCLALLLVGTAAYIHMSFKSVIMNSNISVELHKISTLSQYTAYVYLSTLSLLTTLPLLLRMLRPALRPKRRFNMFSRRGRSVFAIVGASYLLLMSLTMGLGREENRLEIWANRMAVDRSLGFELQLRTIENAIATDPLIPSLLSVSDDYRLILDRISENYMSSIAQDYDVVFYMYNESDADQEVLKMFNERLRLASPISDNSRLLYSRTAAGRAQYTGMFVYYSEEKGVTRLLMAVDSRADKENRGYSTIKGSTTMGGVAIPSQYSFAKYFGGRLVSFRGEYAYPTLISGRFAEAAEDTDMAMTVVDKRLHFVSKVSDGEYVVISRPRGDVTRYIVAWVLMAILIYAIMSIYTLRAGGIRSPFERNYFKTRIQAMILVSLMTILVTMAVISVFFVYSRNRSNITDMMTGKISTIQSLLGATARNFTSIEDFVGGEMTSTLGNIGEYTKSDISLFTPRGRVFRSTAPELFERMQLGYRLDQDAYEGIVYGHKRYFIHREKLDGTPFYAMYAPVFNDAGNMLAIVCSPYTESALDLRIDALFYSVFIVTVFFLLLLACRWLTGKAVDRMFGPLIVMGSKMNAARTDGLEYIIYEREDEVSSVVRAYNLMVHDLNESSKQMAQVERDKAWSEMARQVAHEIKNPLTPIKLQIQRIIRLRERNAPGWEEKFDAIVPVILGSIDTLTDTANEFSTFAKLYTEEPVLIDLDQLAKDETALFSERDDVTIEYRGLQGATVMGPKPQLTRVFVNLLTNAVQAIDNAREEDGTPEQGQVILSIRNSTKEGYYDIVFEDNGPGVKDENRSHLFTPNFTTKSSGTGLGLAICKNILERCGGEIFYSKSFSLGGACFTCRLQRYINT